MNVGIFLLLMDSLDVEKYPISSQILEIKGEKIEYKKNVSRTKRTFFNDLLQMLFQPKHRIFLPSKYGDKYYNND